MYLANKFLSLTPPAFGAPVGVALRPVEFRGDLWRQKTMESLGYSAVFLFVILFLAVL